MDWKTAEWQLKHLLKSSLPCGPRETNLSNPRNLRMISASESAPVKVTV